MNVHIAPQRNHQKARKRSFGLTFGFSSLSRSAWKGTFTRLKKNRCPNQMMPNMMCPNRSRTLISDGGSRNMRALYTHSAGRSTHSGSSARLTSGAEWDGELLVLREQARNPVGRKRSERPPTLRPRSSPSHSAHGVAPRLRFDDCRTERSVRRSRTNDLQSGALESIRLMSPRRTHCLSCVASACLLAVAVAACSAGGSSSPGAGGSAAGGAAGAGVGGAAGDGGGRTGQAAGSGGSGGAAGGGSGTGGAAGTIGVGGAAGRGGT